MLRHPSSNVSTWATMVLAISTGNYMQMGLPLHWTKAALNNHHHSAIIWGNYIGIREVFKAMENTSQEARTTNNFQNQELNHKIIVRYLYMERDLSFAPRISKISLSWEVEQKWCSRQETGKAWLRDTK